MLWKRSAAAAAKSLQSCLTLCDSTDSSPPGSPIPGILQARTLEWVAISFSSAWKWKVKVKLLSCVWSSATPWTAAFQAPPSMGFSRQEYWSAGAIAFSRKRSEILTNFHLPLTKLNNVLNRNYSILLKMVSFVVGNFWCIRQNFCLHGSCED